MGLAPVPILVSPNGAGSSLDGSIVRNVVDDAVAGMSNKLLIYLRAGKISVANTSLVDALGNPITQAAGNTKNTSDSNFNNHESVTFNNQSNVFATKAGGIGVGASPIAMTNSFTFFCGIRNSQANFSGYSWCLYGDGTNANGGVGVLVSTSGQLEAFVNGATEVNAAGTFSAGITYVFWYSYDAATKIHRWGLNSGAIIGQVTGAATRSSQGGSTICYPFGWYSGGNCGLWTFHRWGLFNKAFMNGAVAADDQQFAAMLATYANYI